MGPFTHQGETKDRRYRFGADAMKYMAEPCDFPEFGLRGNMGHIYAFESAICMMENVVNLVLLKQLGFHIQELEVEKCFILPDGQVAFLKNASILIGSWPVEEFPFEEHF